MNAPFDLTNCDREPIHLLGNVQRFGCLVAVSQEWLVTDASANCAEYLGVAPNDLFGKPLANFIGDEAVHDLRGRLQMLIGQDAVERVFGLHVTSTTKCFDAAIHAVGKTIVLEFEPCSNEQDAINATATVRTMLSRLQSKTSLMPFYNEAVRQLRGLIGFDRIMLYRFDEDGCGEVIAESARSDLVKFLGLHYPASDIPKQARVLYLRNWLRIIPDITIEPSPILSAPGSRSEPIDLSMSMLRSVSPIHIEYLSNMGVAASLSVSIIVNGKLWGLFACHHYSPRHISYARRSAAELFGQMLSLLLESRERAAESEREAQARTAQSELTAVLGSNKSNLSHLADQLAMFEQLLAADGVAVWLNGDLSLRGMTPTREEVLGIVRHVARSGHIETYATHQLAKDYIPAEDFPERAAGALILPISRAARDYIIFFRKEIARTVTWGGDPTKPASLGPNGVRLTPRKSFDAWKEVVQGQSRHWTALDLRVAEILRVTLLEVVLRLADVAEKERRAAGQRQELLIAELNHRVRNILSLIRGLIMQSKSRDMTLEEFANVVGGRVQALARAHDQITVDNWGPASMRALFVAETAAYLNEKAGRVKLTGPEVLLEPQAFSTLALVVHELLTNSAKYGALCDSVGKVDVKWHIEASGRLKIEWAEEGGPPVQAPTRRGFGSTIIERSIPYDLNGEAQLDYQLAGFRAQFAIPANFVKIETQTGAPQTVSASVSELAKASTEQNPQGRKETGYRRGLIVEDNLIIAMDAEASLERMGVEFIDIAANVSEALHLITQRKPDFAILDVNLGGETSFPIADKLADLAVPFIFTTGYGKNIAFPDRFENVPVVTKPYSTDAVRGKLAEVK